MRRRTAAVSDGMAFVSRTFNLTLTNTGPVLAAVGAQTATKGQTSISIARKINQLSPTTAGRFRQNRRRARCDRVITG